MTPAQHLIAVHGDCQKILHGFLQVKLDTNNPLELDRLAVICRTVAVAAEVLADRAEALSGFLLDQG